MGEPSQPKKGSTRALMGDLDHASKSIINVEFQGFPCSRAILMDEKGKTGHWGDPQTFLRKRSVGAVGALPCGSIRALRVHEEVFLLRKWHDLAGPVIRCPLDLQGGGEKGEPFFIG